MPGGAAAGLAYTRVEADVADEVARGWEASDVADHCQHRRRAGDVDAGDCHQPPNFGRVERLLGDSAIERRELAGEEVELAQAGVDRVPLILGQLQLVEPTSSAFAEQVTHRRLADQVAHQHCRDFVLEPAAPAHQLCAPGSKTTQHRVRSSPSHTLGNSPAASSSASVRASKRSVFTFAWLIARTCSGFAITTSPTCGARMRAIASVFPVASSATRSSPARLSAQSLSSPGLVSILPAERAFPPSEIATSQKSRWTSRPMKRTSPPFESNDTGDATGERQLRIRARGTAGSVAGAASYVNGLTAQEASRPARSAFSHRSPSTRGHRP